MNNYSENHFTNPDGLRQYYRDYNTAGSDAPVVLCLPGLTRNSRDFAEIADHMSKSCRVICLDLRGRGNSEWDPDPSRYRLDIYVSDVMALLAELGINKFISFGTSLGGMITFMIAAMHPGVLIGAIINDIGPEIDPTGIKRIKSYVGGGTPAQTWDDAVAIVKAASQVSFPKFTEDEWLWFTRKLFAEENGKPVAQYDPLVSGSFAADDEQSAPDLWPVFDLSANIPMVVLRGAISDILSADTLEKMAARHPDLTPVTVPDKGHIPMTTEPECIPAIDALIEKCR